MDELNNKPNPFNEENNNAQENRNTYEMPSADPYNLPPAGSASPYGEQQQSNPYQQQSNPYQQQSNPYQQQYNPYQQPQQFDQGAAGYDRSAVPPQNGTPYGQYQQNYSYNQQNIPQQGYVPQQGYGMPYQPQPSAGMAVASLVLGILSIFMGLFMFSMPVLFLMPIIGIVLGVVFKCKHLPVGKGLSTAGIITSAVGLAIPVIMLILMVIVLITNGDKVMDFIREFSPEQYEELYELYGDQFPQWFGEAIFRILR